MVKWYGMYRMHMLMYCMSAMYIILRKNARAMHLKTNLNVRYDNSSKIRILIQFIPTLFVYFHTAVID